VNKIRVLVIDDSLFVRRNLPRILESTPDIQVIDTAENGAEGLQKVKSLRPDVVVLDLLMPVMDGLTVLRYIMHEAPTPVVMLSSTTYQGARETLEALARGAVDFVTKPGGSISPDIQKIRDELAQKIRTAHTSKPKLATNTALTRDRFHAVLKELAPERKPAAAPPRTPSAVVSNKQLVAIAASTGGPVAIQRVLVDLPANLNAGIVVVLHIAPGFVRPLAERLNELTQITVRQAQDGEWVTPGVALIAPAGAHITIVRRSDRFMVRLSSEPSNTLHRPSADVLFESIAECCAPETCGVILTGMGDDGAAGLCAIRRGGGYTIAQDEATCVVYGMPRRAVELCGVDVSLPLDQIAAEIVQVTSAKLISE
jgi:two-component system chemotaxis response regulator CheB